MKSTNARTFALGRRRDVNKPGAVHTFGAPLRVEPGRDRDAGGRSLSRRTFKPRAAARLLATALPLQHTQRIVREAVDVETCMQRIEATPHDDDVRGRHDDRVLAAATLHGERP